MPPDTLASPPVPVPRAVTRAMRAQVRSMAGRMETAIMDEVPHYGADPDRYRDDILTLCRLAVLVFLRILETGRPSGRREVAMVEQIATGVARLGEPLEPLLHALRIGARVGWQDTMAAALDQPGVVPAQMLMVAGQVFEYIDQLSSRIAETYALQVEQEARARAMSETALFEEVLAGRAVQAGGDRRLVAQPRVALAVATGGPDRAAAARAADTVAARLRGRLPHAIAGQRHGLGVWLLPRDPLPQLLEECARGEDAGFGISRVGDDVPLARAVDEAVEAARFGLERRTEGAPPLIEYAAFHVYPALRADPGSLARYQHALLGPLAAKPRLLQALRAYFESGRSSAAAAARLGLHRQSVIYRLRRAGEVLGLDLTDPETAFRLEAALRAAPAGETSPA